MNKHGAAKNPVLPFHTLPDVSLQISPRAAVSST